MVTLRSLPVGEVAIVGPAISAQDADVGAAPDPSATHKNAAEAKRAAQLRATAQEVRSMLGAVPSMCLLTCSNDMKSCVHGHFHCLCLQSYSLQHTVKIRTVGTCRCDTGASRVAGKPVLWARGAGGSAQAMHHQPAAGHVLAMRPHTSCMGTASCRLGHCTGKRSSS